MSTLLYPYPPISVIRLRAVKKRIKGRRCGEPCPPCKEQCLNACEHRECSKRCDEPCDVPPCNEPCKKLLKCSPEPETMEDGDNADVQLHRCVGICGEDCIEICRICEPEKFSYNVSEVFFGTEDDEDARFVQLKDCKHILEVTGLDRWIEQQINEAKEGSVEEQQGQKIVTITCPKCKTPIRRSKRYVCWLNERAKDIESIKKTIIGKPKNMLKPKWAAQQERMRKKLAEFTDEYQFHEMPQKYRPISERMKVIMTFLENDHSSLITSDWMETMENVERILDEIFKMVREIGQIPLEPRNKMQKQDVVDLLWTFKIDYERLAEYLLDDLVQLVERLHNLDPDGRKGSKITAVSGTTLVQLSSELARNAFMLDLFALLASPTISIDMNSQNVEILLQILGTLFGDKPFIENRDKLSAQLKQLYDHVPGLGISHREMVEINKALYNIRENGQWYKCSKGHFYQIGNCGEAMEKSQCPECKETIGGEDHRLVGTSQQAGPELREGIPDDRHHNPFEARFFY